MEILNRLPRIAVNGAQRLAITRGCSTAPSSKADDASAAGPLNEEEVYARALSHQDYFGVRNLFTINDMMKARVHFGHKMGTLDDRMKGFLFGHRLGVCIFDLEQTRELMAQALNFLAHMAYRNAIILFVSQDRATMHLLEGSARQVGEYSHCRRWRSGLFTDSTIRFGCQIRLPDVVVMTNTMTSLFQPHEVIVEAAKMAVPVIGVVDSNCNPNLITYPIPGNDDSPVAVRFYIRLFSEAIRRGKKKRSEDLSS